VVFVHGLGSGKDSPRNLVLAYALADAGIAALLFDLSGHGESDPDPRPGNEPYIEDLASAFHWAARHPAIDPAQTGVAGSSLGAVIALEALRRSLIRPAALVLRAPPLDPGALHGIDVPTLIIFGSRDPLLPQALPEQRGGAVALALIEGAGHTFDEPGALEQVVGLTVDWFSRHLLPRYSQRPAGSAPRPEVSHDRT